MGNNRYGDLFDTKGDRYGDLFAFAAQKTTKQVYGSLLDGCMSKSLIAYQVGKIKEKIKSAVEENTVESRKTARELQSNFFASIKADLKNKAFALYEKGDGTVAAFVFDNLVECHSWISKNPDTLKTMSFEELFKQYKDCFTNIDNYRVTDGVLIIMFKEPSDNVSPAT